MNRTVVFMLEKLRAHRQNWKSENPRAVAAEWDFALRGIPDADLVAAFDRYIRSDDQWPNVGKILNIVLEIRAERRTGGPLPTAPEAWERCRRVAIEYHAYCDTREHEARKAKLTPIEEEVYRIVNMDGYHELTEDAGRATLQKRFLEAYDDQLKKPRREMEAERAVDVLSMPEVQHLLEKTDLLKELGPGYADEEDPRPPRQIDEE